MAITYVLTPCFGAGAQFFDGSGVPLAGGFLYSFLAGTTTPEVTWTSHTGAALNSNPIVLDSEGRVPEMVWINLAKSYKFRLEDHNHVEIWTKDYIFQYFTPAVPPVPPPTDVPELTTVWQFMTPQQIADVKARTFTLDVTVAIQTGIDYVAAQLATTSLPLGKLYLPAGGYRITAPLTVTLPGVIVEGAGMGGDWTPPITDIQWYGGADDGLVFGTVANGLPFYGGGFRRLGFNGRGVAHRGLLIRNARVFTFEELYITQCTVGQLELNNPKDQPNPLGLGYFRNLWLGNYGTSADGIRIIGNSPTSGPQTSAGSTLCLWDQINIKHTNGSGVYVNGGDNHQWNRFIAFRSGGGTGPGIYFAEVVEAPPGPPYSNTESAHTFINASANGGVRCDSAGDVNDSHTFINFDDGDLDGNTPFYGNGIGRINATTHFGKRFGHEKTLGLRETIRHDGMQFIAYNSPVLTTAQGNWVATANAVTDAGEPGGAIQIDTNGVINNIAALYSNATPGASGISTTYNPTLQFLVAPINVFNTLHRWGYLDTIAGSPTNGIFVEINHAAHPNIYRMGLANAGVVTYADVMNIDGNPLFFGADQLVSWRFDIQPGSVAVYFRLGNVSVTSARWIFSGTYTTGLPAQSAKLDRVFWLKAVDANVRSVWVYDVKEGFNTEQPNGT